MAEWKLKTWKDSKAQEQKAVIITYNVTNNSICQITNSCHIQEHTGNKKTEAGKGAEGTFCAVSVTLPLHKNLNRRFWLYPQGIASSVCLIRAPLFFNSSSSASDRLVLPVGGESSKGMVHCTAKLWSREATTTSWHTLSGAISYKQACLLRWLLNLVSHNYCSFWFSFHAGYSQAMWTIQFLYLGIQFQRTSISVL